MMVYSRAMVEVWKFGICFTGAANRMCYKLDIMGGEREKEESGGGEGKGERLIEIHTEREILKFLNSLSRMTLVFHTMKMRKNLFSGNG